MKIDWTTMTGMFDQVQSEPLVIVALVQAGIALATAFGFHLTAEQNTAILTFSAALFAALMWVRSQVVPVAKSNAEVQKALMTPVPSDAPKP